MKTPTTGSPRVPAPWRSAQGEAGPKARPQRRSRWRAGEDSGPARSPLNPDGTLERRTSGHVDRPSNGVGAARAPRDRNASPRPRPTASRLESAVEKSVRRRAVGVRTADRHRWARRAASGGRVKRGQGTRHTDPVTSEEGMHPRVTALHCGGSSGVPQRIGPSDCLAKTQVRAKPRKARYTH